MSSATGPPRWHHVDADADLSTLVSTEWCTAHPAAYEDWGLDATRVESLGCAAGFGMPPSPRPGSPPITGFDFIVGPVDYLTNESI
jgi:hypothetical protein